MEDVEVGGYRSLRSRGTRDLPKQSADNRITRSRSRGTSANSSIVPDRVQQDSFEESSVSRRASKRKLAAENSKDSRGDKKKVRKESNGERNRKQDCNPAMSCSLNEDEVKGPVTFSKRSTRKVIYTERHSSSSLSENGSDHSSDGETETGKLSSDSSQSTHEESDSPIPTSELSDSSKIADSNSDDSSGSEVLLTRKRTSPRKLAQAKSRKKIAEQFTDGSSEASSESSYSEDL